MVDRRLCDPQLAPWHTALRWSPAAGLICTIEHAADSCQIMLRAQNFVWRTAKAGLSS